MGDTNQQTEVVMDGYSSAASPEADRCVTPVYPPQHMTDSSSPLTEDSVVARNFSGQDCGYFHKLPVSMRDDEPLIFQQFLVYKLISCNIYLLIYFKHYLRIKCRF